MTTFARPFLAIAFAAAMALGSSSAKADTGAIGVHLGGVALAEHGETRWHPVLRGELGLEVAGPLMVGALLQSTASELLFADPSFGAGLFVALRPEIFGISLHAQASIARTQLPSANMRATVWEMALTGGVGIPLAPEVSFDARLTFSGLAGAAAMTGLGSSAVSLTGGLVFTIP